MDGRPAKFVISAHVCGPNGAATKMLHTINKNILETSWDKSVTLPKPDFLVTEEVSIPGHGL